MDECKNKKGAVLCWANRNGGGGGRNQKDGRNCFYVRTEINARKRNGPSKKAIND